MSGSDSDHNGLSLFRACQKGHVRRVTKLLQDGADIEEINDPSSVDGWGVMTPLQGAVNFCQLHIAKLLIYKGANMSVLFDNGESLLMRTSRRMFDETHLMADLLIKNGADVRYEHRNVTPRPHNLCRNIIPEGQNNWQALHIAAYCGRFDVVDVLLHHGADLLALTSEGETAKDLALKDYILKTDFKRYHDFKRYELGRYMKNDMPWWSTQKEHMEYLRRVRGYYETVRLLRIAEMRIRQVAFAMGHHPRLGEGSALMGFSPEELTMILNHL